jgi:phosphatidylinositol kinase/protein kinase (PI-3  family)
VFCSVGLDAAVKIKTDERQFFVAVTPTTETFLSGFFTLFKCDLPYHKILSDQPAINAKGGFQP